MTLTEFLLARIAEDEAIAQDCINLAMGAWGQMLQIPYRQGWNAERATVHADQWGPHRVLAECEAKRDAIRCAWDDHCAIEGEWGSGQSEKQMSANDDNPGVVRFLASVYADHPDYREEWKP